jgi:hypothetical protein
MAEKDLEYKERYIRWRDFMNLESNHEHEFSSDEILAQSEQFNSFENSQIYTSKISNIMRSY